MSFRGSQASRGNPHPEKIANTAIFVLGERIATTSVRYFVAMTEVLFSVDQVVVPELQGVQILVGAACCH